MKKKGKKGHHWIWGAALLMGTSFLSPIFQAWADSITSGKINQMEKVAVESSYDRYIRSEVADLPQETDASSTVSSDLPASDGPIIPLKRITGKVVDQWQIPSGTITAEDTLGTVLQKSGITSDNIIQINHRFYRLKSSSKAKSPHDDAAVFFQKDGTKGYANDQKFSAVFSEDNEQALQDQEIYLYVYEMPTVTTRYIADTNDNGVLDPVDQVLVSESSLVQMIQSYSAENNISQYQDNLLACYFFIKQYGEETTGKVTGSGQIMVDYLYTKAGSIVIDASAIGQGQITIPYQITNPGGKAGTYTEYTGTYEERHSLPSVAIARLPAAPSGYVYLDQSGQPVSSFPLNPETGIGEHLYTLTDQTQKKANLYLRLVPVESIRNGDILANETARRTGAQLASVRPISQVPSLPPVDEADKLMRRLKAERRLRKKEKANAGDPLARREREKGLRQKKASQDNKERPVKRKKKSAQTDKQLSKMTQKVKRKASVTRQSSQLDKEKSRNKQPRKLK